MLGLPGGWFSVGLAWRRENATASNGRSLENFFIPAKSCSLTPAWPVPAQESAPVECYFATNSWMVGSTLVELSPRVASVIGKLNRRGPALPGLR